MRNTPCTECRKHRRKCIRIPELTKCSRCQRLGKICVQPTKEQPEIDSLEHNSFDVEGLQEQIKELEWTIHQMENQMRDLGETGYRSSNTNSQKYTNNNALTVRQNSSPFSNISEETMNRMFYNWKFKIVNGTFQIETGIRNISDLLPFNSSISYLSPISTNYQYSSSSSSNSSISSRDSSIYYDVEDMYRGEQGLLMSFGSDDQNNLVPLTIRVLTRCIKNSNTENPKQLLLPRELLEDPDYVINGFLNIYFACHNVYYPLVHENSFRSNLAKIKDPLTDLVTLSICCYVCSTPCEHIVYYSGQQRRNMADFFYTKAKNIVFDQFDSPEKRIENVVGINLLSKYLHMTLKFSESRQLISMSYQICLDLRQDYGNHPQAPLSECFEPSRHAHGNYMSNDPSDALKNNKNYKPVKDVNKLLYSRHATSTICLRILMNYIANEAVNETCFHFPRWEYMEDEPIQTKLFASSQNWILDLFNHPFIGHFMTQIHLVHIGKTCTLTFESIVRISEVIGEWGRAVPPEFRICDDMTNFEMSKNALKTVYEPVSLINFIQFHSFQVSIFSCLLQPIALCADNNQLLSYVQKHSLDRSLESSRLILLAIQQLRSSPEASSCEYSLAVSEFLFQNVDVLVLLSFSPNQQIAKEARIMMKECLAELDKIHFMKDHHVPKRDSPMASNMFEFYNGTKFNIEYYDQYAQPWFALMYDASHFVTSL